MAPIETSSVSISCRHLTAVPTGDTARVVLWLHGEHDLTTVADLAAALAEAITLDDTDVMVDVSDVQFMGAATVGVLCRAGELLRVEARRLVLRSPPSCVRRVLELCAAEDLLVSVDVRPAAGQEHRPGPQLVPTPAISPVMTSTAGLGMP